MNRAVLAPVPATLAALLFAGSVHAAEPPSAATPPEPREPVVERLVVEDDGARIEELRVRGEPQQVTVQTKGPLKSRYEVVVPRRSSASGSAAGKSVWHVLAF